jgi:hypothetical protein
LGTRASSAEQDQWRFRFARDSALEQRRFELPVPAAYGTFKSLPPLSFARSGDLLIRDREFESTSLQQGVCCEPASLHQIKFRPRITKIEGQRATAHDPAPVFPDMVKKWGLGFMISTEPVPGSRPSSISSSTASGPPRICCKAPHVLADKAVLIIDKK